MERLVEAGRARHETSTQVSPTRRALPEVQWYRTMGRRRHQMAATERAATRSNILASLCSRRRGVCAAPLLALGGADALPLFSPVDALRDKMTERGAPDACRRSKTQNILAPVGFEPTPANGLEP